MLLVLVFPFLLLFLLTTMMAGCCGSSSSCCCFLDKTRTIQGFSHSINLSLVLRLENAEINDCICDCIAFNCFHTHTHTHTHTAPPHLLPFLLHYYSGVPRFIHCQNSEYILGASGSLESIPACLVECMEF